jgi:YVTN family beta-propeller protein
MRTRLSDNDLRSVRARADLEHLRSCARCQEFGSALRWRPPQLAALAPPPASAPALAAAGAAAGAPALRPQPGSSRAPAPRSRGGGRGGGGGGGGGAARRPFPLAPGSRNFRAALVGLVALALAAVTIVPALVGSDDPPAPPAVVAAGAFPDRLYVPNGLEGTVDVIDPSNFRILDRLDVGRMPQHVIPSWDMKRLYVLNAGSNTVTQIDPKTATKVKTIAVPGPDNLYWTIDGKTAVVVSENLARVDFRHPDTFSLIKGLPIPGNGPNHLDFSGDGSFMVLTTELDGRAFRIDTKRMEISGQMQFSEGSRPVDVMLIPSAPAPAGEAGAAGEARLRTADFSGSTEFFVADQGRDGVAVVDGARMRQTAFIPTGKGAHGFALSHDGRWLYVTNRLGGSISRIDVQSRAVTDTWNVGGSPDMVQVSPDGRSLNASNRFDGTVTVLDAETGKVLRTITVGAGPHGLCRFPQPARLSTGHCVFR